MPRTYVPKDPSERKPPKRQRGPKPETVELGRRCLELLDQGVERSVLFARLHVTRKQIDHAMQAMKQLEQAAAGDEPVPTPTPEKPRRAHRAVHQRPSEAGAPASWKWQDDAACRGEELNLFFGPEGERGAERLQREQEAKAVCKGCDVRDACLDYAMGRPEAYGTWGGLDEDTRKGVRRQRMRKASEARAKELAEAS